MTVAEAKIEIERLSELIHQYNYSYYVETSSKISDFEFDTLLKKLQELELGFPELSSANSPTKRVGADISKKFETIEHEYPMLSLSNTYSQEEIIEQDNYAKQYEGLERDEIIKSLREDEEQVLITKNIVGYKRNPKRIGAIKELGKFQCQICQNFILKKNGGRYIEAAHIKAKHLKGQETIQNILLLCPNHHKEFDFGDLEIINWDDSSITFILNEIEHTITFIIE